MNPYKPPASPDDVPSFMKVNLKPVYVLIARIRSTLRQRNHSWGFRNYVSKLPRKFQLPSFSRPQQVPSGSQPSIYVIFMSAAVLMDVYLLWKRR